MFDNLNTNKQQNQGGNEEQGIKKITEDQSKIDFNQNNQSITSQQQGQTNLKVDNNVVNSRNFNKQQMTEDIFAEVDKEVGKQVVESLNHDKERPKLLQPKNITAINEAESAVAASLQEDKGNILKKSIFAMVGILILGSTVYGCFWFYNNLYKQKNVIIEETSIPIQENVDNKSNVSSNISSGNNISNNSPVNNVKSDNYQQANINYKQKKEIQDTDQDGLSDQEEKILGTNIYSIDSDNDGLFDREEVKTYKTDPLNPDTDGDGYKDGEEVKNGYNPLGKGKLYEINK